MVQLIIYLVKYIVAFLCCTYTYAKVSGTRLRPLDLLFFPLFAAVSFGLGYVTIYAKMLVPACILLVCIAAFWARFRQPIANTVSLSAICLGFYIVLMVFATLVCTPILMILFEATKDENLRDILGQILQAVTPLVFAIIAFHIKKFKNGIMSIKTDDSYERLLLLSVMAIFGMTLFYMIDKTDSVLKLVAFYIVFCGLALIVWWRRLVSSSYMRRTQKRSLSTLERALERCERERAELIKQNEKLAKIIHRDNKLLPAMRIAVNALAEKYSGDETVAALSKNLEALYSERVAAIQTYGKGYQTLPKTQVLTFDAIIELLSSRAEKQNTQFTFNFNSAAVEQITKIFADFTDFCTILCDLGENALIAVKNIPQSTVNITVCNQEGFPCLTVYDNGAPFDEKVIAEMGRCQITTHAQEGGSGLGLLSLFQILKKYNASFMIDETPLNGFTKCVSVILNGAGNYCFKSSREEVRRVCAARDGFLHLPLDI